MRARVHTYTWTKGRNLFHPLARAVRARMSCEHVAERVVINSPTQTPRVNSAYKVAIITIAESGCACVGETRFILTALARGEACHVVRESHPGWREKRRKRSHRYWEEREKEEKKKRRDLIRFTLPRDSHIFDAVASCRGSLGLLVT